ncbi:hypothetical protein [Ovoidimarina sediminis]|uniref:hypothetical protein n=1 Tax=Ovoidimarina sediminis TaxID=3079856 RepID=UPI00291262A3|nr:hypothetical protein [Rhodophyticola sp. MJ-SS7]MDU8943674.1 hypothetical protein [Rhodophyticola sp. MJ-SS7]
MNDRSDRDRSTVSLGVFGARASLGGLSNAEIIALALSALWLLAVTVFFFAVGGREADLPADPVRGLTIAIAVFMPVALIWVACIAAGSARTMRDEAARLQSSLDSMRKAYVAQQQAAGTSFKPSFEKKLDEIAAAQRRTDDAIAAFASIRAGGIAEAPSGTAEESAVPQILQTQPGLDLADQPPPATNAIAIEDFITALNFPESPEDDEGFAALRRAMRDRRIAELVQASQDMLTLLSQEGIYMDDMAPDRARPELWRRFAEGERGRTVAGIGGIRDRSAITLTSTRMRQDHVFRDTAHHFLRKFDHTFTVFEKHATDAEIVALAETRTARAFMLLGRVAGTFD